MIAEFSASVLDGLLPGVAPYRLIEPHVRNRDAARLPLDLPALGEREIERMIRQGGDQERLTVYVPGLHDGREVLHVDRDCAWRHFRSGATVEVPAREELLPGIDTLVRYLSRELKVRTGPHVLLLSPPGRSVPRHFDQVDVFVLQLAGSKHWSVSQPTVRHPVHSYFVARESRDDEGWPSYFPGSFEVRMPADAMRFTLSTGSVAYIPCGYWHETRTDEVSVSLTLGLKRWRFIDAFLRRLADRLLREEALREPTIAHGDEFSSPDAHERLVRQLEMAIEITRGLPLSDFVPAKTFAVSTGLSTSADGHVILRHGEPLLDLSDLLGVGPMLRWLVQQRSVHKSDFAVRIGASMKVDVIAEILQREGILEPID